MPIQDDQDRRMNAYMAGLRSTAVDPEEEEDSYPEEELEEGRLP